MKGLVLVVLVGCGRIGFDALVDPTGDEDGDGIVNADDLCVGDDRVDVNGNGVADACDPCLGDQTCFELGVPNASYPNWTERVFLVGANAVRSDPIGFRDTYMTFLDGTGSLVFATDSAPRRLVHYSKTLNEGARFHATDRMGCAFNSTPSNADLCDGTPHTTWAQPYGPVNAVIVAPVGRIWQRELAFYMVGGYVCSAISVTGFAYQNCTDDANVTRFSIALSPYGQLGPGWASDATRYEVDGIWTNNLPPTVYPIPSGGHFFWNGGLVFALNYELTEAPPRASYVVIDGVRFPLERSVGTELRGMAQLKSTTDSAACASFHFELVDASGMIWRYPGHGELRTFGDGPCNEDWIP